MKNLLLMVIALLLICSTVSHAKIPDEILAKKSAVVTIYIKDKEEVIAFGSGFIIDAGGIVVTNHHVIEPWHKSKTGLLYIKKSDGTFIEPIEIIASDKVKDIAIIRVKETNLPTINMSVDYKPIQGDDVVVIGTPLGFETTVSNGIISGIRGADGFLQISAPISSGSSGSPVLNAKGDAIGVATLVMRGGQNLNFAVPVSYVRKLLLQPKINDKDAPAPASMVASEESADLAKRIRGTVLIKTDTGGYTYIKCDVNGTDVWIAMPEINVNVGQLIEFPEVPPLTNFESKSLRMKFDKLSFVPGIWIVEDNSVPASVENELLADLKKYVVDNDYAGAIQTLDELIELSPQNPEYHYQRGDYYLLSRKFFNDENNTESGAFDNSGICQSALNDLNKAIALNPNIEKYYSSRASLLTDSLFCNYNSNLQAIKDYEILIKFNPKEHTYWNAMGDIYLAMKDYPKTLECAKKAIELKPKEKFGYYLLGNYYAELANYPKALENLKKGMLLAKDTYYGQFLVSEIMEKTEKYHDGIKLYSDLIKESPKKFGLYSARASLYTSVKEYKKAIDDYNVVINNTTSGNANYRQRAYNYYELGNKVKALEDYRKACEMGETTVCDFIPDVEADIKRGDKWVLISSGKVLSFYYDKKTLEKKINGIVSAWLRVEIQDKDAYIKQQEISEYELDKYKNVSHSLDRVDIDCNGRKIRTFASYTYNEDGNQINSYQSDKAKFNNIIPDSVGSQIESSVCSNSNGKKGVVKKPEKKSAKK